jgi:hypothetical protein
MLAPREMFRTAQTPSGARVTIVQRQTETGFQMPIIFEGRLTLPLWPSAAGKLVTAGIRTRTLDELIDAPAKVEAAADTLDLIRMDDDGGWQMPSTPGEREPGALTRFRVPDVNRPALPQRVSTVDAVTTAEHQREGGGAPNQRRPSRKASKKNHV